MKTQNNERIILDDMTVFIFWESFIGAGKMKDENWRYGIAKEYAKRILKKPVSRREVNKFFNKMTYRFNQFVKLGLFDVYETNNGKHGKYIYSLRETDIIFRKIKFSDNKRRRSLVIRIDD